MFKALTHHKTVKKSPHPCSNCKLIVHSTLHYVAKRNDIITTKWRIVRTQNGSGGTLASVHEIAHEVGRAVGLLGYRAGFVGSMLNQVIFHDA